MLRDGWNYFSFWAIFCPFTLLAAQKIKIKKKRNEKNAWTLRKISSFHLNCWCGNFVERHSFRIVSETMEKLCLSEKFPHQEIR